MSESSREHLSSLIDGEMDRKGRKFLVRRLAGDAELRGVWNRMHTVRACLHQERLAAADLVSRVARQIEAEPAPRPAMAARWLRPVAGGAIAASVALMAIVGINSSMMEQGAGPEDEPGFVSQSTSLDKPFTREATPVGYSEDRRAQRQRISGYVLRHNQAAGSTGFVSYVPIVTDLDDGRNSSDDTRSEDRADDIR